MKKRMFKLFAVLLIICLVAIVTAVMLNAIVKSNSDGKITTIENAGEINGADCIMVLGCLVKEDGVPSHMLEDRLSVGIDAWKAGVAPKILMTGDHGSKDYDEVNVMKAKAMAAGVPSEDVFMDHAGFSTYESMYRAKEVFGVKKMVIVSQGYHLYRAIYIAEKLGIEAYGISADLRGYSGQRKRDIREFLARYKDVFYCMIKPEPKYLGEFIDIAGDGNLTNDQ